MYININIKQTKNLLNFHKHLNLATTKIESIMFNTLEQEIHGQHYKLQPDNGPIHFAHTYIKPPNHIRPALEFHQPCYLPANELSLNRTHKNIYQPTTKVYQHVSG